MTKPADGPMLFEVGSLLQKWPSPRYAQILKIPLSRILKSCVYYSNQQSNFLKYEMSTGLQGRVWTISEATV